MFILLNRVRPINVGFSNRFFCLSDKRFLNIIIKKKLKKINLKVRFFPPKIADFFWFLKMIIFEALNHYIVTKSGISPQRNLGCLRNLKLQLIRH